MNLFASLDIGVYVLILARKSNRPVTLIQNRKGTRQVDKGDSRRSNVIVSDRAVRGDGQSVDQEIAKSDISYICSGSVNAFAKYALRIYDLRTAISSPQFDT